MRSYENRLSWLRTRVFIIGLGLMGMGGALAIVHETMGGETKISTASQRSTVPESTTPSAVFRERIEHTEIMSDEMVEAGDRTDSVEEENSDVLVQAYTLRMTPCVPSDPLQAWSWRAVPLRSGNAISLYHEAFDLLDATQKQWETEIQKLPEYQKYTEYQQKYLSQLQFADFSDAEEDAENDADEEAYHASGRAIALQAMRTWSLPMSNPWFQSEDVSDEECQQFLTTQLESLDACHTQLQPVWEKIELASQTVRCDWEWSATSEERTTLPQFRPEWSQIRSLARYLHDRAEWQLRRGQTREAWQTITVMGTLRDHIANIAPASTVEALIILSLEDMETQILQTALIQPNAPNRYWSLVLRNQERPYRSMVTGVCGPFDAVIGQLSDNPQRLRNPDTLTTEEMHPFLRDFLSTEDMLSSLDQALGTEENTTESTSDADVLSDGNSIPLDESNMRALEPYRPAASERLIRLGYASEEIAQWDTVRVVVPYLIERFMSMRDQLLTAHLVAQQKGWNAAQPYIAQIEETLSQEPNFRKMLIASSLATLWNPDVLVASIHANLRAQTQSHFLIVLEALRWYAGEHEGRLPSSLDEMTAIPMIPNDAFTGQPFSYVLDPTSDGRAAEIRFRDFRKNMPLEWRYRIEMVE